MPPRGVIVPPVGRMLPGRADVREPEDGMVITFDAPCSSISELDLLFVRSPSGEPLRLRGLAWDTKAGLGRGPIKLARVGGV